LSQLKKLLRATKLANPKTYTMLKNKTNQQQIEILSHIFDENQIPHDSTCLTDKVIAQTKKEYEFKHELKELGINQTNIDSSERSRRPRKKSQL